MRRRHKTIRGIIVISLPLVSNVGLSQKHNIPLLLTLLMICAIITNFHTPEGAPLHRVFRRHLSASKGMPESTPKEQRNFDEVQPDDDLKSHDYEFAIKRTRTHHHDSAIRYLHEFGYLTGTNPSPRELRNGSFIVMALKSNKEVPDFFNKNPYFRML